MLLAFHHGHGLLRTVRLQVLAASIVHTVQVVGWPAEVAVGRTYNINWTRGLIASVTPLMIIKVRSSFSRLSPLAMRARMEDI